jgi:very-short-patch-repair endonuclease
VAAKRPDEGLRRSRGLAMRTRDLATTGRAERLRVAATDTERKLWYKLRDRRLGGAKFVRQAPVGRYFADFLCRETKLAVEIDGSQHAESRYDDERDAFLLAEGYSILRFWNGELASSIDNVCETILAALEGKLEPFDRFKTPTPNVGAAPHPALRATFPPQSGEKGLSSSQEIP